MEVKDIVLHIENLLQIAASKKENAVISNDFTQGMIVGYSLVAIDLENLLEDIKKDGS